MAGRGWGEQEKEKSVIKVVHNQINQEADSFKDIKKNGRKCKKTRTGRDIKEGDKEEDNGRDVKGDGKKKDDCLQTYTAQAPNLSFIKEKTVTYTVNKCEDNPHQNIENQKTENKRMRRKNKNKNLRKNKKNENDERKAEKKERKNRRKMQRERRRQERRDMELFAEQQRFKEWKRKESMDTLLQKPLA